MHLEKKAKTTYKLINWDEVDTNLLIMTHE
jgi:hypothetical protein